MYKNMIAPVGIMYENGNLANCMEIFLGYL